MIHYDSDQDKTITDNSNALFSSGSQWICKSVAKNTGLEMGIHTNINT